jgi:predicted ester cyclase
MLSGIRKQVQRRKRDQERVRGQNIDRPERDRLAGFPDLTTSIQDMFVSGDKLAVTLIWRGMHTGPYGGVAATGKSVEVRDTAIWHFTGGKVTEILTLQDQFAFLKQIGYPPDSVRAA